MSVRTANVTPRLLTRQQAALYCGVSVGTFSATCPVRAVAMGEGRRLERFDVQSLDQWIDRMKGEAKPIAEDWLDRI